MREADDEDPTRAGSGDPAGTDVPPVTGEEPHDPAGLGLARLTARAVGAQTGRRRRSRPARPDGPQVSGARADDRDPTRLGAAMERLVESQGWTAEVSLHALLARWALLVGPANASHSHPEGYQDGVLTVRTDSTAWATQLRYLAPRLVAQLNAEIGQGTVTAIRVLGPDAPSWKRGRRSVRDGRGPRDTYG